MKPTLYVCETCRYSEAEQEHQGQCGGEILAQHLESQLQQQAEPVVNLKRTRCLMACKRHCTVHLRGAGKINYVIGDFQADAAAATTLLQYSELYGQSSTGQVAYKSWPEAIKGHFVARTPAFEDDQ